VGYVFTDPPVEVLTLSPVTDGTAQKAELLLNKENPITTVLQVAPSSCQGELAEYQGEDGVWHGFFLGTDGRYATINHMVYVEGRSVYSATIQKVWAPLFGVVAGRNLRIATKCYNARGTSMGEGYLYFGTSYAPWAGGNIECKDATSPYAFCGYLGQQEQLTVSGAALTAAVAVRSSGYLLAAAGAAAALLV
jgi:hypothetical protein